MWRDDADRAALATVRERSGAASESDALRLAVRLLAESTRVTVEAHDERTPLP